MRSAKPTTASPALSTAASAANFATPSAATLRLFATLSHEAATTETPRAFAATAARAAAGALRASHCGITEILADGRRLSVHVYPLANHFSALPKKFEVDLSAEDCVSAAALRSGHALAESDVALGQYRDSELQALGLASALVVPLASQTHTYGALAVYHEAPMPLAFEQLQLVEGVAHLVTGALARCRAQSLAQEQQQFAEAMLDSMESLLLVISADGTIERTNPTCQTITGFERGDLVGRSILSALMLPEEVGAVKQSLQRCVQEKSIERFETYILTSDGLRRRIVWTASPLAAGASPAGTMVVTGVDITDRCEAVERATRAEAMAEDARRLCNELQARIRQGEAQLDSAPRSRRLPSWVDHDRRARARRLYPYVQKIAPMRGTTMPDAMQFQELLCYDISSRGFSFILPNQPDYQKIIVAFGTKPALAYLTADVRHITHCKQNGRTQYIVGCRYTGRITKKSKPGERKA